MSDSHPALPPSPTLLSIVVPIHNEAACLPFFFEKLMPILQSITIDWEIICVDDGSSDDSAARITAQHADDARIKLIRLSRNFGKEAALTAGLQHSRGQAIIPIDADLQDPPTLIPDMIAQWQAGYKVVLAARQDRQSDSWFKQTTARWFYRIIGKLSNTDIPANVGDFRLMDREVVHAILQLPERTRFMKGILSWAGFSTTTLSYDRPPRIAGDTSQPFVSLWRLALDGIFSFTTAPLKIWTYIGALISTFSFIYAIFLIFRTLFSGSDVPGYASLMVAILFIGGIQLISLGIIGEYIGRIYRETKCRPLYIIAERVGVPDHTPSPPDQQADHV